MKNIVIRIEKPVNSKADFTWDDHGYSLMCKITYLAANPSKVLNLSEKLDLQFNIREHNYILTGGFFEMMLDPQKRIIDWSIYTNPKQWIRTERTFEEAVPASARIDAEFDENGRTSMGEPKEFHEPIRGAFYLSWAQSSTWYEIAPGMALGVTEQNHLAELRLDGFFLPEVEQKVERLSLWKKLRQLI
ncbi:hypothetical protein [Paraburkholderia antibiotica]|uniref:Uncharacterized protein n=1 Tax=Paraburkholderia antibiotica TaxID=2728839 RepID=A0A7X9X1R2_9BURK|nr:hypothetical protein [Paraburkholderia antibiotica]NML29807.1 hypothetical protein [Paraburkholderia antibiotica]